MKLRFSRAYNTAPRFLNAKYTGVCAETGAAIQVGDRILYHPEGKKVYCENSKTYTDFDSAEFDRTVMGHEY